MRKWLAIAICVLLGGAIGYAGGYATFLARSISNNPALGKAHPTGDGFDRVFDDMARLGADEWIAVTCTGHAPSDLALGNEALALRRLAESTKQAGLSPPLDLAEARLLLRRRAGGNPDAKLQAQTDASVKSALERIRME